MKKAFLILFVMTIGLSGLAQEEDELQTLFGKNTKVRGFFGPTLELTALSGEFSAMLGAGGGILLDDFFLGGYGVGLTNTSTLQEEVDFGYGGLFVGYTFLSNKPFHPGISALFGLGSVSSSDNVFDDDNVFVITPAVELEVNLARFMKASIGATYRFVGGISDSGAKLAGYTNQDFSGPAGIISLRFGWFD
ncbi:MAG: hypothetical protein JSV24_08650 [Bacteroidales bacterium]|nr:MAG: hypothetical protein JSV24_08650 [Bacteroidales bacterium]